MYKFDFYEIIGVIAPGMMVIIGVIVLIYPEQYGKLTYFANLSIGGLGVGLLLAYIAGQLVQAIGNGIEKVWWRFCGGMPTDWLRTGKRHLIADAQRNQVQVHLSQMLKKSGFELSNSIDSKQWYSITRQIYAVVSAAKRSARVDTFNGNYGLCRGIIASVFVLLIFVGFVRFCEWRTELALFVIFALALYRMHHFGVLYARELFVQFIAINLVDDMQSGGKGGNEK